jgi:hypothetical protein
VIRPTLRAKTAGCLDKPIVLLGTDHAALSLLAQDLEHDGAKEIQICVVDAAYLASSGLPVEEGGFPLSDDVRIDYLFFVHDRHDGNKDAARQYLAWETGLVAQIDQQERDTFSFL